MSFNILSKIKRSRLRGNLNTSELRALFSITNFQEYVLEVLNNLLSHSQILNLPKHLLTSSQLSEYLLLVAISLVFEHHGFLEESETIGGRAQKIRDDVLSAVVGEDPNPIDTDRRYESITQKINRINNAELLKKILENGRL